MLVDPDFEHPCRREEPMLKTLMFPRRLLQIFQIRFNFQRMSDFLELPAVNRPTTLDPLPSVLQKGLVAVAFFGILSLVASSGLFFFLSYKLCRWYYKGHLANGANQFLLLIYNLLLADIQQAMAFSLTAVYVVEKKVDVGTTTCWANGEFCHDFPMDRTDHAGWFVSTGDLASGVFILSIALHTWFAVVKGRSISNKIFYSWIIFAWIFVYVMAVVNVSLHDDTYVRAGAWVCCTPSGSRITAKMTIVLGEPQVREGAPLAPLLLDFRVYVWHHNHIRTDVSVPGLF